MPIRVLAVIGGLVALAVGSFLSLGLGLVALLGFGAAALLSRVRHARLTRRASWIGAVLAVALAIGGLTTWAASRSPVSFTESMQRSMDQASRQPPPPIVRRMQQLGPPQDPRVQKGVDSITRSKPFLVWAMVMGMVMGSLILGLLVGTPAWGCAMLIGYGIRGRWTMQAPGAAR